MGMFILFIILFILFPPLGLTLLIFYGAYLLFTSKEREQKRFAEYQRKMK